MNVFDQSARFAVQHDPVSFFRWLTPGLDAALDFHGWLDTRTLLAEIAAGRISRSLLSWISRMRGVGEPGIIEGLVSRICG